MQNSGQAGRLAASLIGDRLSTTALWTMPGGNRLILGCSLHGSVLTTSTKHGFLGATLLEFTKTGSATTPAPALAVGTWDGWLPDSAWPSDEPCS